MLKISLISFVCILSLQAADIDREEAANRSKQVPVRDLNAEFMGKFSADEQAVIAAKLRQSEIARKKEKQEKIRDETTAALERLKRFGIVA